MTEFLRAPWAWPRSVSSRLIEGPLEEPLTLTQGKLRAGLDWPDGDPRDDLMKGFIAAARQQVEQDTGLALIKQIRVITLDLPAGTVLPLPAQALPLLAITDDLGTPVTADVLAAPQFLRRLSLHSVAPLEGTPVTADVLPPPAARAQLDVYAGTMLLPYGVSGTWRITAGWPDAATFATEAPLLLHAVGLLTAHYATLGRDLASSEEAFSVPMGYEAAIAPFRLLWVA